MTTLQIRDLHVSAKAASRVADGSAEDTPILMGVDLTVRSRETHALMGPNGSGKSTLAYSIAGHPKYVVTQGEVLLDGQDVLTMTVDERGRAGLFLAMQYPVEVPGVSVSNFLRTAVTAIRGEAPKLRTWAKEVNTAMAELGIEATAAYEGARDKVAAFINAARREEVVFTRNSSEGLNLLAYAISNATTFPGADRFRIGPGDEVVVTEMEHHSNIVPWQLLCQRTGATFRWLPIDDNGRLVLSAVDEVITERTKVVAFVHQSNALGTINPVSRIVARAREVGALTVVDTSQSAPHLPLDVQALGADFVAFTGHKLYGPTGVGVLWGRFDVLAELPPFLGGGEMIETVDMTGTTHREPPHRFEAGTPMIAQAV